MTYFNPHRPVRHDQMAPPRNLQDIREYADTWGPHTVQESWLRESIRLLLDSVEERDNPPFVTHSVGVVNGEIACLPDCSAAGKHFGGPPCGDCFNFCPTCGAAHE